MEASNNKELLDFAAKAAGIDRTPNGFDRPWNPLVHDGDALRLAVKLGLLVDTHGMHSRVCFPYEAPLAYEPMGDDHYAATRRAIVRAAAEIGRKM